MVHFWVILAFQTRRSPIFGKVYIHAPRHPALLLSLAARPLALARFGLNFPPNIEQFYVVLYHEGRFVVEFADHGEKVLEGK